MLAFFKVFIGKSRTTKIFNSEDFLLLIFHSVSIHLLY